MANEYNLDSISLQEKKTYSSVLLETKLSGITLQEEKTYDLRPVRNKAFLGGITLTERVLTPDVQIRKSIYS